MREIEAARTQQNTRALLRHRLALKVTSLLLGGLLLTFATLGYLNIRLHRQHLEAATLSSAERVSDVIKRSTSHYMLHNDREGLYRIISTMANEPGMVRVRIIDQQGLISFSSQSSEIGSSVDKSAEACYGCHAQSQPLSRLNRPDRFRVYRAGGTRVLGIINPIENQVECSSAPCHAHPASQKILGVLDTNLSLAPADASLAQSSLHMLAYTLAAMLLISLFSALFVWRVIGRPVRELRLGTEQLAAGNLGHQIQVGSHDELGELAGSFNAMSRQLQAANAENVAWTRTLQARIEEKTSELQRAHEHMLHTEKMASIGKMAAVLAHEINNPLSSVVTYAKLVAKWVERDHADAARRVEMQQCLELIGSEGKRCGELVKNLLVFSRYAPLNLQPVDVNGVVERCAALVQHQAELSGIELRLQLAPALPPVQCDASQIEQVLLALVLNAMDAMPHGGTICIGSEQRERAIQLTVRDDGAGISAELLPHIFEPFQTTKEAGRGVGLGLAISRSIVERHNGSIEAQSKMGEGATFIVCLPAAEKSAVLSPATAQPDVAEVR